MTNKSSVNVVDIQTYTTQGAVLCNTVLVPEAVKDFPQMICDALEEGCALLDLVVGGKLILNPLNAVAVEIGEQREATAHDYEQA